MNVEIIKCLKDNYSYLITDSDRNSIVIDPSESDPIIKIIEKKKLNLKFILNTHHHFDHIGGNDELKKKYSSEIVGFKKDKDRIPGIDISVSDNEVWKSGNFEAKIIYIPGHTSGHIAFYFYKNEILFSGDTLFSLGCGRVFEGTHQDMFNSLNKLKALPPETKIFCGHEYTKTNLDFCLKYDTNNSSLKEKSIKINSLLKKNLPTIPTTIDDELKSNIFLRCNNSLIKQSLNLKDASDQEVFTKLRDLKDTF